MGELAVIKNKLIWQQDHEMLQIETWGSDSLRIRATHGSGIEEDLPGALLAVEPGEPTFQIWKEGAAIRSGALTAEVSAGGNIRFIGSSTGAEILAETPSYFPRPPARSYKHVTGAHFKVEVRFKAYGNERLYGLGQHQHGRLNQKGLVVDLLQRNTEVCIPFLLSSRGYGFLWNNPAVGRVEMSGDQTRWVAEATPQIDYWITCGDTPAAILERYADATGHVPPLPPWAAGFWQCKLRYRTQEELLGVAREYRRRGLPLSVIVADFFHWTVQGEWRFDPHCWPDPAGMVRELEAMGVKLMVSIWPTVNPISVNFREMQARGLLVRTGRGLPAHMRFRDNQPEGPVDLHYYDPTHPEARRFIWNQVKEGYHRQGVKVWWLDACEPEMYPMDADNLLYHLGDGLAVTNLYPLYHARGFYEGMRAEGETEVLMLCRSAWAGSQRYGAAMWSGDIQSTFEALQAQVPAGLNIGLSGIPWWTTDIGGFFGGDPDDPDFRELIVRWFQYGAFCPLFRLHGYRLPADPDTGGPNEVWSFGEQAYQIIREMLFLRERLRPYIRDQMQIAHLKGTPPMRPLFFDFPSDAGCDEVDDQFMLGPDLLVAPVLHAGVRERKVYLPAGIRWKDVWAERSLEGGQWVTTDAPLERIPLFLRGGAELPIQVPEDRRGN